MQFPNKTVFSEATFWTAFCHDLEAARYRVLIQSPFLAGHRIGFLANTFRRIANRGVTVCTYVQEPREWIEGEHPPEAEKPARSRDLRWLIQALQQTGAHVTLRREVHEKLAVIDENILWEGSLNILSYRNTKERMRRWTDPTEVLQAVSQHRLDDCSVCYTNHARYGLGLASMLPPAAAVPLLLRRLADRRAALDLSQGDLAHTCGTTQSVISRIEMGKSNIGLARFLELAHAVDLEPVLVPRLLVPSVLRLLQIATEC
jgi:DNA-binding XRE family transcriptional regulator